ncbi:MAG: ZIP family metal transporter [Candidatus Promineifilaceae bacterium]|nr:ZIP family metal transporter [Anaerolineaceae bacterium]
MLAFLEQFSPLVQTLFGTGFTWGMTALGAAVIFLGRGLNRKILDWLLGFAAGVMIAASYWSLLAPALEMAQGRTLPAWVPAVVGFLAGGLFLRGLDKVLPHLHFRSPSPNEAEGAKTTWQRTTLLVLAITLHNIPEGLAVGVAFGAAAADLPSASVAGAVALAFGIGIQNFPEAVAVSMPLYSAGMSRRRSFFYGQLSGFVEPMAGVLGVTAVLLFRTILPYALAFAAGAMIFVVIEDLIPEAHNHGHIDLATMGAMIGFATMMTLDVALG